MNLHPDILKVELLSYNSEDIEGTIDLLEEFLLKKDGIIQIKGRYNRYKGNLRKGVIDNDEINIEINRISSAIESLIGELEENNLDHRYKDWLSRQLQIKKNNQIDIEYKNLAATVDNINNKLNEPKDIPLFTKEIIIIIFILLGFTAYITHYITKQEFEKRYTDLNEKVKQIGLDVNTLPSKGIYTIKSSSVEKTDTFQQVMLEFWTPSVDTKDSLMKTGEYRNIKDIPKRYIVSTDQNELYSFERKIKEVFDVEGYSRFKVIGFADQKTRKPGWYWKMTLNIEKDGKKYSKEKFLTTFRDYWERPNGIYLIESFLKQSTHFSVPQNAQ